MTEKAIRTLADVTSEIIDLYQSAFPEEEQIPFADLMSLVKIMNLQFTTYHIGDKFIGLTIVYPRKSFNWFWYFAVKEELRGQGLGQQILTNLIQKHSDKPNILDMESPEQICDNSEQRKRRHNFYLRNGFRDTGVGRSFEGIDYTIMMNGEGTFTIKDYDDILTELRQCWASMPKEENQR